MNTDVDFYVRQAQMDYRKGDYMAYQEYVRWIQKLGLDPHEYQQAIKRLAKALEV